MAIAKEERFALKCDVCGKDGDFWSNTEEELLAVHRDKGWFIEFDIPHAVACCNCVSIVKKVRALGLNLLDLSTEPFVLTGGR